MRLHMNSEATMDHRSAEQMALFAVMIVFFSARAAVEKIGTILAAILIHFIPAERK